MTRIFCIIVFGIGLSAYSCKSADQDQRSRRGQDAKPSPVEKEQPVPSLEPSPSAQPSAAPAPKTAQGVVVKGVEASCWLIKLDSGETVLPMNLSDEFKQDGIAVDITYLPTIAFSICMQGKAVEIKSIKKSP